MAVKEKVSLVLDVDIADAMARAAAAGIELNRLTAIRAATWEPHDWSDWEA